MDKIILENYLAEGKTSYEMAELENCGQTTIRYWLKKYGLKLQSKKKYQNKEEQKKRRRIRARERYYSEANQINCAKCNKILQKRNSKTTKQFCSPCWQDLIKSDRGSYVYIKPINHFGRVEANGFAAEHRFIAEVVLDRILKANEVVHHISNDSRNNELNNLCVLDNKDHASYHGWLVYNELACNKSTLEKFGCETIFLEDHTNLNKKELLKGKIEIFEKTPKNKIKKDKSPCIHPTKINWPAPEKLASMVWENPTSKVAEKLGVSDKAVEKWCKKYGIEKPPRGYWAIKKSGKVEIAHFSLDFL